MKSISADFKIKSSLDVREKHNHFKFKREFVPEDSCLSGPGLKAYADTDSQVSTTEHFQGLQQGAPELLTSLSHKHTTVRLSSAPALKWAFLPFVSRLTESQCLDLRPHKLKWLYLLNLSRTGLLHLCCSFLLPSPTSDMSSSSFIHSYVSSSRSLREQSCFKQYTFWIA